jgi:hypothetical protein
MEATYQKFTAIIMGLGSMLFIMAAFLPYARVFGEPLPEKSLQSLWK